MPAMNHIYWLNCQCRMQHRRRKVYLIILLYYIISYYIIILLYYIILYYKTHHIIPTTSFFQAKKLGRVQVCHCNKNLQQLPMHNMYNFKVI